VGYTYIAYDDCENCSGDGFATSDKGTMENCSECLQRFINETVDTLDTIDEFVNDWYYEKLEQLRSRIKKY
jgi:hypothetical protein